MTLEYIVFLLNKKHDEVRQRRNHRRNHRLLNQYKAHVGINFTCNGELYINGQGEIYIGNNVNINSSIDSNPIAGYGYSSITLKGGKLTIGDGAGISNSSISCCEEVTIEENVAIGSGCMITDTDFHSLHFDERNMENDPGVKSMPVKISRGAFVGARSIILKGVTIGEESVIAAGAVVTKNVPSKEIWGGNPAKFIRNID